MKVRSKTVEIAVLAAALLLATAAPAFALNTATVNAHVEVNPYSIVLDEGANLDYGMLNLSESGMPMLQPPIVVRNNGGLDAQLSVIGTDATNGTGGTWELDPMSVGADQFRWEMAGPMLLNISVDDEATTPMSVMPLMVGQVTFVDTVLHMPASTTAYGTYSWSATIYATAP